MPRAATGQVIEYKLKEGRSYAIRFRAGGQRHHTTLGSSNDGWTRAKAEEELANTLADVRRGVWKPPSKGAAAPVAADPTFHAFSSRWLADHRLGIKDTTAERYEWALQHYLLPFFEKHRLSEITIAEVDRYRARQLERKDLGATSINMTIALLAQILDVAIEHHPGLLAGNPARGRRRRVKAATPRRTFLEAAEVRALLDAAGELDATARADRAHLGRRAMLATMALGGLRVGELIELRWRDVDLAAARIHVRGSKTAAAFRTVDIGGLLRGELAAHKAELRTVELDEYVFPTSTGRRQNRDNIRNRILGSAVKQANKKLEKAKKHPLPEGITPHSLRRTYISLLLESGENPRVVMAQVGHADPGVTLRIYAQVMERRGASAGARVDSLIRRGSRGAKRSPPATDVRTRADRRSGDRR